MIGHELAIEQRKSPDFQPGHQPRQCHFRRVAGAREHAFTAKCAANRQAIETADQVFLSGFGVAQPAFDAMRIAKLVQLVERLFNLCINPGFLAIGCFCRANPDHIGKGGVGRNPEPVRSDGFAQRARHPEIVERDDRAGLGFHPEGFRIIPGIRHREDARSISFNQEIEINGHERGITRPEPFAQTESDKDSRPSSRHQHAGFLGNFLRYCCIFAGKAGIGAPGRANAAGHRPAFDVKQRDIATAG